ncbi:MAG: ArsR/SmtB family transcription factor [Halobacteriaceae archaeon]
MEQITTIMEESPSNGIAMADPRLNFTTISWLISQPRLAYLHARLLEMDRWATTRDVVERTDFSQSTVYDDLAELRETSLVAVRTEGRERRYRAQSFKIGVITEDGLTTITPTITAVIGQQAVDEDVSQFVDNYGLEKLVDTVAYVKPYINGRMTERLAARELDLPAVVGMTILIALEDVVRKLQKSDPFFDDVRDAAEEGSQWVSTEIHFEDRTWEIREAGGKSVPDADLNFIDDSDISKVPS